jgi:Nif-specific regulatory protein
MSREVVNSDSSIDHLREIATWVSSVHDVDQVLEVIVETATRMMKARASSLLLVDRKTNRLYFKVATGEKKEDVKKFEIEMGHGIAGFVAESGEPLLVPDVSKDPRWYKGLSESIGCKTHSIACVPMKLQGETIGVVEIIDKVGGSPFTDTDMEVLAVFAESAAVAIGNARKVESVTKQVKDLKEQLADKHQIAGDSKALKKAISDAHKVADSRMSALILGESGTGKELLAWLIHRASPRKQKSMIVLNCAALPESLLEDELFGHEKGAYTGAMFKKIGKFELADGGTLFLDEIAEMNAGMQARLLRVLQEGRFYSVGGNKSISVDVRVISATNKNIEEEVSSGRFREDLYYRLNGVQILVPSLRERKEDIPILAQYFLDTFKQERGLPYLTVSQGAMEKMLQYDWPGNVRELKNAIERAVVMGNGHDVLPEDLPILVSKPGHSDIRVGLTLDEAMNDFKKGFITLNLKHTAGNRSKAAEIMGIQRTYLSRLISKYSLQNIR